ncbi:MAG: hypothetical protein KDB86_04720 [Actinobacteria bacterium]|nr:hypothetical protein [Actinomycetota bacterium]MCB9389949.1 hypothetical protein [Acidimicrobiia bacterium]
MTDTSGSVSQPGHDPSEAYPGARPEFKDGTAVTHCSGEHREQLANSRITGKLESRVASGRLCRELPAQQSAATIR